MKEPHSEREQQDEQLVDALLEALFENQRGQAQSLVDRGLQRLEQESPTPSSNASTHDQHPTLKRRGRPWQFASLASFASLAAVAVLLLAIFLPFLDSSGNAMAAVARSLERAMEDVGRHYSVSTRLRLAQQTIDAQAELFVKGGNRCVYRSDSPMDALPVWLGNDRGQTWVVPPIGPVLYGDADSLDEWAEEKQEIATPYLHVSSFLQRMQESYTLQKLPNVPLETTLGIVDCQHIVGELSIPATPSQAERKRGSLPRRLELWAHQETGIAMKVIAAWDMDGKLGGRESVTIEYLEEVELADEFFTPNAHGGKNRPRLGFERSQD